MIISRVFYTEFRSVHKHVLFATMPMHIDKSKDIIIFWNIFNLWFVILWYQFFNCAYYWMKFLIWILVLSIQIISRHWNSIISNNHSIRILAWYNFKHNSFSKFLSYLIIRTGYKLHKTFHHKWRISFTRMHSCGKYDNFLCFLYR